MKYILLFPLLLLVACVSDQPIAREALNSEIDFLLEEKFQYEIRFIKDTYVESRSILIDSLARVRIEHEKNPAYQTMDGRNLRSNQLIAFDLADDEQREMCLACTCSEFQTMKQTHLLALKEAQEISYPNDQTVERVFQKTKELVGLKVILIEMISSCLQNQMSKLNPETTDLQSLINERISRYLPEIKME